MNLKKLLAKGYAVSIFSIIVFGLISIFVHGDKVKGFDDSIISFVQGFEAPSLTVIMKFFSWIGSTEIVAILSIVILLVLYKFLHHRLELILFIAVIGGTAVLNQVLKMLFHRSRPSLHRLADAQGFSFPSGHSMEAVALYGVLAFLLWRHIPSAWGRRILAFLSVCMILAIGISRIYLGVHYPSDVIGAYFASIFWLTVSIWIFQRYKDRQEGIKNKELE
ncbi:phosphatase PAP2 family protein [Actinomycetes bacterium NPDC127524]